MARWITVSKVPFDYIWPGRQAITAVTEAGEHFVKDELADFAIERGYAKEGKANAAKRSVKAGGRKSPGRKKGSAAGNTANSGTVAAVAHTSDADADRPADRPALDPDAE